MSSTTCWPVTTCSAIFVFSYIITVARCPQAKPKTLSLNDSRKASHKINEANPSPTQSDLGACMRGHVGVVNVGKLTPYDQDLVVAALAAALKGKKSLFGKRAGMKRAAINLSGLIRWYVCTRWACVCLWAPNNNPPTSILQPLTHTAHARFVMMPWKL